MKRIQYFRHRLEDYVRLHGGDEYFDDVHNVVENFRNTQAGTGWRDAQVHTFMYPSFEPLEQQTKYHVVDTWINQMNGVEFAVADNDPHKDEILSWMTDVVKSMKIYADAHAKLKTLRAALRHMDTLTSHETEYQLK